MRINNDSLRFRRSLFSFLLGVIFVFESIGGNLLMADAEDELGFDGKGLFGAVIYLDGEELEDGDVISDGEDLSCSFNWSVVNNSDIYDYSSDLALKGIVLTDTTGELKIGDDVVGSYEVTNNIFYIHLDPAAVEDMSNIVGGAILTGTSLISEDRSEADGSTQTLAVGDYSREVTYSNPGTVDISKSVSDNSPYVDPASGTLLMDYQITVSAREIMSDATVTDAITDPGISLKPGSLSVTPSDGVTTDDGEDNITVNLPDSGNKSEVRTYVISYTVLINGSDRSSVPSVSPITNTAVLDYTDEHGQPQTLSDTDTTDIDKPEGSKTGVTVTDSDGTPYVYNQGNTNYFATLYTIAIDPGDYKALFEVNSEQIIDIDDQVTCSSTAALFTASIISPYMSALASNSLSLSGLKPYGSTSIPSDTVDASDMYYVKPDNLTASLFGNDQDVITALKNAARLYDVPSKLNLSNYPVDPITIGDFTYNDSTGKYEFPYILFVPADGPGDVEFSNHFEADVFGVPIEGEYTTKITFPPVQMLYKGPGRFDINNNNIGGTTGPSNVPGNVYYTYEGDTLAPDEDIDRINFTVGADFGTIRYQYTNDNSGRPIRNSAEIAGWSTAAGNLGQIVIEDDPNTFLYITPNGEFGSSGSGSSIIGIDEDSICLDIVQTSSALASFDYSGIALYHQKIRECNQFLEDNGGYQAVYADQTLRAQHLSLISSANSMRPANYIGTVILSGSNVSLDRSGNKIVITIDSLGSMPFGGYGQSGSPYMTLNGSFTFGSAVNFIGNNYSLILSYDALINSSNIAQGSGSDTYINGSRIRIGDITTNNNEPVVQNVANVSLTLRRERSADSPGSVTLAKQHPTSIVFQDQTFNYDTPDSIGFIIRADLSNANPATEGASSDDLAARTIVITDSLPDNIIFAPEDYILYASNSTSASMTSKSYEEVKIDPSLYSIAFSEDNKTVTITLIYSHELSAAIGGARYINAYLKTDLDIDNSVAGTRLRITNIATGTYGGNSAGSASVTVNHDVSPIIDKITTDSSYQPSSDPVVTGSAIYGYYRLDVNPDSRTLNGGAPVEVKDQMSNVMILDLASVELTDADTGTPIAQTQYSITRSNNEVLFTVPDRTHVYIQYRVRINVDPVNDPIWMRTENTGNSVSIVLDDNDVVSDSVDFSSYRARIKVWIYEENGSVTIEKFALSDRVKVPVTGAVFTLSSVYNNTGYAYDDGNASRLDIGMKKYGTFSVSDSSGLRVLDGLPLDVIYRLEEITLGDNCVDTGEEHVFYFYLEGNYPIDFTKQDVIDHLRSLGITPDDIIMLHNGDTLSVENHMGIKISGTKTWVGDAQYIDLYRPLPEDMIIDVYADGELCDRNTLNVTWSNTDTDIWNYEISALPKYNSDGDEITYTVIETPVPGYIAEYDGYNITNTIMFSDIEFYKFGTTSELGADDRLDSAVPLAGARFALYSADDEENVVEEAVSDGDGRVIFAGIEYGEYIIRELEAPEGYVTDPSSYSVTVNGRKTILKNADGSEVRDNRIVNELITGQIRIRKVNEQNQGQALPGSTYGLYRMAGTRYAPASDGSDDDKLVLIASSVTDDDGYITFDGVMTGVEYTVKELEAPDGYYVSDNPILLVLGVSRDGGTYIKSVNDGEGTVCLDPQGNITWLEPEVVVNVTKTDGEGHALSGAVLAIRDIEGNIVAQWTSSQDVHILKGVLKCGQTYVLTEISAPDGYKVAPDITFAIDSSAGPDENKVIDLVMADQKITVTASAVPSATASAVPSTGESEMSLPAVLIMASAAVFVTSRLRRKNGQTSCTSR